MVVTRACHLDTLASTLIELADIVEQTGLSAGDVGRILAQSCADSSEKLSPRTQRELAELCGIDTSAADFARGLRRQAEQMLRAGDAALL